jgi:hypothetical protein
MSNYTYWLRRTFDGQAKALIVPQLREPSALWPSWPRKLDDERIHASRYGQDWGLEISCVGMYLHESFGDGPAMPAAAQNPRDVGRPN